MIGGEAANTPRAEFEATPEVARGDVPRIYAASLSDYNAGRLHGAWIDCDQDHDDIAEKISEMLAESKEGVAEEWAIHDTSGWGPVHLSEYESLEDVARLGTGIATHGMAFAHLAAHLDTNDWSQLDRFEELYLGEWDSAEDYAANLLEDLGIDIDEIGPEMLQPYIRVDLEAFARDLSYDLVIADADDGHVHIFDTN